MKRFTLAISFFGLLLGSNTVSASDYSSYIGLWSQHYSGDLIDEDGRADVESQLKIKDSSNIEVGASWHGQDGWVPNVRLRLLQIHASGSNTISQANPLNVLGMPVITGTGSAEVATEVDYLVWSGNFYYDLQWRGVDFELGATLNYVDGTIDADVDYDSTAEATGRMDQRRSETTNSIIPTGYGAASKKLNDWLSLELNLYGATTATDSFGQYSIALAADWKSGLALVAGYRAQSVDFFDEDKKSGLDVDIAGLFGGLSYHF